MAEQAASAVASAVIGGVTDRALTTVMRKLGSGSRRAAAHEKLQRLETLVLKLRCAVEVSEKHAIGSASLLEWRDRLRQAAAEGGAVVLDFQRRAREGGEAASTSAGAGGPGQQQPTAGALYFTRSAVGGMAQRVRDATRRLFSTDEDTKKLDSVLEKMERLSPDITQFLMALQLEVTPAPPAKKRRLSATEIQGPFFLSKKAHKKLQRPSRGGACKLEVWPKQQGVLPKGGEPQEHRSRKRVAESAIVQLASAAETLEDREREARMLAEVLEGTLLCTETYYLKNTDDREMGGLEWLAEWAAVLREAVERGNAVLQTLRPGSDAIHNAGGALELEEDGELYSFARAVERLARDVFCFAVLVDLCPRKH